MKRKCFAIVLLAMVSILPVPFIIGSSSGDEAIRIGMTGPFTGPSAEAGIGGKQGVQLAADEWNTAGGITIDGKSLKIQLFFEDTQSKPEVGVSVAEKLIARDKVHFLFGDSFNSSVSLAVMELAPKYKIPISTIQCVSKEISNKIRKNPQRYTRYFKAIWDSDAYGYQVADTFKYLIDKRKISPKSKTIAFVVEDTDYGRSNAEVIKQEFEKMGWKTATTETVPLGHTDFYPQLSKIKTLNPDVIVTTFVALASGVAFVKQFQELALTSYHLGIYFPLRSEFIEQAGKAADFLLWSPLFFDPESNPVQKQFAEKVRTKFNVKASFDQLYGYDIMNNALTSIKKAGTLAPDKLVAEYSKVDRVGILGRYVFGKDDHTMKFGEGYLALPTGQILEGKNYVIWPEKNRQKDFVPQPWVK
jgi:branched-chain amino acid transport system substrate-binding protein